MDLIEKLIAKKKGSRAFRIALHLACWLFYWLTGFYFNTVSFFLFKDTDLVWKEPLFNVLNLVLLYYPLVYFTWPMFIRKRRFVVGILLLLAQVLVYTAIFEWQERALVEQCAPCREIMEKMSPLVGQAAPEPWSTGVLKSLASLGILYVIIARLSPVIAVKALLDFTEQRIRAIGLEKENVVLEHDFLRSQVNPHFLFNTLNNIHSLVVQERNLDASVTIGKLSDLLRHALYDGAGKSVPLAREIGLLQDYVELEKLRLNRTEVRFHANTVDESLQVPPLLFMPVLENAFKYSADSLTDHSYISLQVQAVNGMIDLECRNNYDPRKRERTGGIGLQNLRKRLLNHYPERHTMDITDDGHEYKVTISIST